ncbi:maleylpyruvate isomerase family mycothiol-dependent enzyme [Actinoallomurus vinaceus]|uniref:Maleylpyruvate isomerase family mycothiol-dependent enzyme n=1 Tax=Actinoallomurus vinaceus TaxID=1080074 RepID=A0ABP8TZ74_9ACTN
MSARTAAATRVTQEKWTSVRTAVSDCGERFAALIESTPDPSVSATGHWSVAETAAHVTGIAWNYTVLGSAAAGPLPIPEVRRHMPTATVDNIHAGLNPTQLRAYRERDPARLAARLRSSVREMLTRTADEDPGGTVEWLGGSRLPLAGVFAHLMNELHIHGRDIACGTGAPWRIPDDEAGLFFELFLVEIIRNGTGVLLHDDRPVRRGSIAVEFRSAHTVPVTFVLDTGVFRAEEPSGRADVRIRFRPAALNLMLFHRTSVTRTALSGAVVASGRRPWLLPAFLREIRMP